MGRDIFRRAHAAFGFLFQFHTHLHGFGYFPVHNHDAYAHFWPIHDWRFISPLSYYEQDHHSGIVSLVELFLVLGSITILWRRFPKRWIRGLLLFFAALYILAQIAFRLAPLLISS